MSDLEAAEDEQGNSEFTFDVVISIPEWVEKSVVEQRAKQSLGAPPEVLERIMQTLATHRVVKVKTDVTREKADKTAKRFEAVGFRAEVTHALKLKKMSAYVSDGKIVCPACDVKVQPSPETQCPNCGVFIKNLTPEFLERKRLMKKELEKAEYELRDKRRREDEIRRTEFEKKVREEVRAELERKYKGQSKKGVFGILSPLTTLILLVATAGTAFVGGRFLLPGQDKAQVAKNAASAEPGDDIEKVIKQTNQLQADMAKLSTNPDAPDAKPLIDPKDSLASIAASDSPAPASGAPLSEDSKREVANQLVLVLAEIGQIERAREMIDKAVASHKTGADLKLSSQLRVIQLEVEAWAIVHGHSEKPQEQIDALTKMVADLPDAGDRTIASATIGAILLRRADLLPQAPSALFELADASYKAQPAPRTGHILLIERGRGLYNSAKTRIERGLRQQAINLTGQLGTMTRIAPEASAAVLHGFDSHLSSLMGNTEGAKTSLQAALATTAKLPSPKQEASSLRALAEVDGIYQNHTMQDALSALNSTAEKRGGGEYANVLFEIGMIHAWNGNEVALRLVQQKLLENIKGKPDLAIFEERLRGLSEVALALKARKTGNLASLENHLRLAAAMSLSETRPAAATTAAAPAETSAASATPAASAPAASAGK